MFKEFLKQTGVVFLLSVIGVILSIIAVPIILIVYIKFCLPGFPGV